MCVQLGTDKCTSICQKCNQLCIGSNYKCKRQHWSDFIRFTYLSFKYRFDTKNLHHIQSIAHSHHSRHLSFGHKTQKHKTLKEIIDPLSVFVTLGLFTMYAVFIFFHSSLSILVTTLFITYAVVGPYLSHNLKNFVTVNMNIWNMTNIKQFLTWYYCNNNKYILKSISKQSF